MHRPIGRMISLCIVLLLPAWAMAQTETEGDTESGESTAKAPEGDPGGTAEEGTGEAPPADEAAPKPATMDKGTYTVRLRDLEDRVNRLKEQIFRSKARLSLLAETVLDRKIAGAKSVIVFRNEMGGSYRLNKAVFLLDGGPIFSKSDQGGNLAEREVIDLFDGPVMPGDHTLSVVLHFRGHGYGIFSYLKGYSFKVRSSRTFTVGEGKAVKLEIVSFEKGGVTTPLEDRPAVRYIEGLSDYEGGTSANDSFKSKGKDAE